jgi:hypothetical protein
MLFVFFLKINLLDSHVFLIFQKEFSKKSKICFDLMLQYLFEIYNKIFCNLKIQIQTWLPNKNMTIVTQIWQTRPIWRIQSCRIPIYLTELGYWETSWTLSSLNLIQICFRMNVVLFPGCVTPDLILQN